MSAKSIVNQERDLHKRLEDNKWLVGDCWRWLGSIFGNGYGKIKYKGKNRHVNRVSAHIYFGLPLDSDRLVLHKNFICKYKDCWNPEHLYIGSHLDNMRDYVESNKVKRPNESK